MNPERLLAIGGIILVLIGMMYGAVYSAAFLPGLRGKPVAMEKKALEAVYNGANIEGALQIWDRRSKLQDIRDFNKGAHTHFTLMGLTSIVFTPYLAGTGFNTLPRYLLATGTLLGALALPTGVMLEIWAPGTGRILALVGGAAFLLSLFLIAVGYAFSGNRRKQRFTS